MVDSSTPMSYLTTMLSTESKQALQQLPSPKPITSQIWYQQNLKQTQAEVEQCKGIVGWRTLSNTLVFLDEWEECYQRQSLQAFVRLKSRAPIRSRHPHPLNKYLSRRHQQQSAKGSNRFTTHSKRRCIS